MLRKIVAVAVLISATAVGQQPSPKPVDSAKTPAPETATNKTQPQTKPKSATESEKDRAKTAARWRERAEMYTAAIVDDAWRLGPDLPILDARLAEAWWKANPVRAHDWLATAVANVTAVQAQESDENRKKRLEAALVVYQIAEKLDHSSADRVMKMLVNTAKERSGPESRVLRTRIGFAMHTGMLNSYNSDPARIEEMIRIEISLHDGNGVQTTITQLGVFDAARANRLFAEGLAEARTDAEDNLLLFGLSQVVFPTFPNPHVPCVITDELKQQLLDTVYESFVRPTNSDREEQNKCTWGASIALQLADHFPAAQAGPVRQEIARCKSVAELPQGINETNCSTSDECLKKASEQKDPVESGQFKFTGAARAQQEENNPEKALDIIDSLTPEERETHPAWVAERENPLVMFLMKLYSEHNSQAIQRALDRTPDEGRASAYLQFATMVSGKGDSTYALAMVSEAWRALESRSVQRPDVYTRLLSLYCRFAPDSAPQIFSFVLKQLNQIEYADMDSPRDPKNGVLWPPISQHLRPVYANPVLLDNGDEFLLAGIKTLDRIPDRQSFRLGFLQVCIQKHLEFAGKR